MEDNLNKLKNREKDIVDLKSLSSADKSFVKKNLLELF